MLEARSLTLTCRQGWFLAEALRENLVQASLLAAHKCACVLACKGIALISASFFLHVAFPLCVSPFPSLIRTPSLDSRPSVTQGGLISRSLLNYNSRDPYSKKGHSHKLWVHMCLEGHYSAPCSSNDATVLAVLGFHL